MKWFVIVVVTFGLGLAAYFVLGTPWLKHNPKDVRYWLWAGGTNDWLAEAKAGNPEAEFYLGAGFLKTNMLIMVSRVGSLYTLPMIGRRFFEKTHCQIVQSVDPKLLSESYRWIKLSSDHGFAPAEEALHLFAGRITVDGKPVPPGVVGSSGADTNRIPVPDSPSR